MHRVIQRYVGEDIGLSVAGTRHLPVRLVAVDESVVTIGTRDFAGRDIFTHIAMSAVVSATEGADFPIAKNVVVKLVVEVFPPANPVGGGVGFGFGVMVPIG